MGFFEKILEVVLDKAVDTYRAKKEEEKLMEAENNIFSREYEKKYKEITFKNLTPFFLIQNILDVSV